MRISALKVENFGSLEVVDLAGLENHSQIVLCGRNGVGKSQILAAIALSWRGSVQPDDGVQYIGPGPSRRATVTVEYELSQDEVAAVKAHSSRSHEVVVVASNRFQGSITFDGDIWSQPTFSDVAGSVGMAALIRSTSFMREHSFADVVYLPAERTVGKTRDASPNTRSLSRKHSKSDDDQLVNQIMSEYGMTFSFDVVAALSSLDYAGFLQNRAGLPPSFDDDFKAISETFERATGKALHPPALGETGGVTIEVALAPGVTHSVGTLSSGELVALQLMYFIRRFARAGSILLVDEPEQHLHPGLQGEILSLLRDDSEHAQLWLATHSTQLLASTPTNSLLVVARNQSTGLSSVQFLSDDKERIGLFDELGVVPGLWVPGNFILVVEGSTDVAILRKMIPIQTAKAFIIVAGDSSSVKSIATRLDEEGAREVPWMAVRDRDLHSADEVRAWNVKTNRFMWGAYCIESLFLDAAWIKAAYLTVDPDFDVSGIEDDIERVILEQKDRIKLLWLERQVMEAVPDEFKRDGSLEKLFSAKAIMFQSRTQYLVDHSVRLSAQFDGLWAKDRKSMVDGKRASNQLKKGPFASSEALRTAMLSILRSNLDLMPSDVRKLIEKIDGLLG